MSTTDSAYSQPEMARKAGRIEASDWDEARPAEPKPETAAEVEWRRRLAKGDMEVIAPVYDHYAAALYHVLTAILGAGADAQDALQEIFVRLAQGRAGRIRNLRAYLFTAARNEACTILRRRRRERPLEESDAFAHSADGAPNGDIQALLQRLPVEQREVIAMKIYEEMTFLEIAGIVRASPNTVASRYRYGIERLRSWIREEHACGNST